MSLRTNFWIDFLVFIGFLIALEPGLTGSSIHEWLTLSGAAVLVLHLLIHWDWVVKAILGFFRDARNITRLNFVLAVIVFTGFTAIITSGLVISRTVVPALGLPPADDRGWKAVHELASALGLGGPGRQPRDHRPAAAPGQQEGGARCPGTLGPPCGCWSCCLPRPSWA